MVWWQKPFVPPRLLIEVWQRRQAGFPRCETLHACDCSVHLVFHLLCWWSPPLLFSGCQKITLDVKNIPVLCRLIPLLSVPLLYLQGKYFSGKWASILETWCPCDLGFLPLFPFPSSILRIGHPQTALPTGPSELIHHLCL